MELTAFETKVLKAIEDNHFGNEPGDWVWADCINDSSSPSGIEGKQLSGVVSSLSKKGLIECDGEGRDACVRIVMEK